MIPYLANIGIDLQKLLENVAWETCIFKSNFCSRYFPVGPDKRLLVNIMCPKSDGSRNSISPSLCKWETYVGFFSVIIYFVFNRWRTTAAAEYSTETVLFSL